MLYQIQDGTVSLGGETILSHFDFEIRGRERIAVVGKNGAGKTTLLRLLSGQLQLDRDDRRACPGIQTARRFTIGFLPQQVFSQEGDSDRTVEEELLRVCPCKDTWDKERFLYEQEYDRLFTGFGFAKQDKQKKLSEFSGGQRMRIALIRLMLEKPDVLLLDEPTNHLDEKMLEWLEEWIISYEKAVVMVSHDRFFLDRTAEVIYELTERKLVRYVGNYSSFVEQKQKKQQILKKEWERQRAEEERLNDLIRKFRNKPRKAAFARSRQKLLERMEKLEKPSSEEIRPFFKEIIPQVISAKYVLEMEELQIGYGEALSEMLQKITLRIRRGQKIGIIGPNGIGKSTFLKTAAGLILPVEGKLRRGERVVMEYFDQQTASIESEDTVKEHFQSQYPSLTEKEARSVLGQWMFGGKMAARPVNRLSGGEKSRLRFAEIFQNCPNFMILDEPTNHMDIQAREMLESALRAYQGTLLFVSHDRYFISRVADALLVFEKNQIIYYPFGYEHYLQRLRRAVKSKPDTAKALLSGAGMRPEDRALMEEVKNVPQAEKGRFQRISTEQAYSEWKLGLAEEDVEAAAEKVYQLEEEIQKLQMQEIADGAARAETVKAVKTAEIADIAETTDAVKTADIAEAADAVETAESVEMQKLLLRLKEAQEQWTEKCIVWYKEDILLKETPDESQ
ncbi:MAG: ATP-binding cassette domain-containing protein [Lachnospiraceae bacterium]|nr:ATP-binding cassette domain-containing protein [Lachnospiraceae bacterium]